MLIIFNGASCPIKYFAAGVQGNNLVDELEFVVNRHAAAGIDLANCKPYIKLSNEKDNYRDKDCRVSTVISNDEVRLTYRLRRKTTVHASFDLQLQFERNFEGDNAENDIIVWQTEPITFTLARTIDADDAVADASPAIIQDLSLRIEKIENIKIINGGTP